MRPSKQIVRIENQRKADNEKILAALVANGIDLEKTPKSALISLPDANQQKVTLKLLHLLADLKRQTLSQSPLVLPQLQPIIKRSLLFICVRTLSGYNLKQLSQPKAKPNVRWTWKTCVYLARGIGDSKRRGDHSFAACAKGRHARGRKNITTGIRAVSGARKRTPKQ